MVATDFKVCFFEGGIEFIIGYEGSKALYSSCPTRDHYLLSDWTNVMYPLGSDEANAYSHRIVKYRKWLKLNINNLHKLENKE